MKIKFLKPKALNVGGIARAYAAGDVRDYLSDEDCKHLVLLGDAEYVKEPKKEEEVKDEKAKAEKQLKQPTKENKQMKTDKKQNK